MRTGRPTLRSNFCIQTLVPLCVLCGGLELFQPDRTDEDGNIRLKSSAGLEDRATGLVRGVLCPVVRVMLDDYACSSTLIFYPRPHFKG